MQQPTDRDPADRFPTDPSGLPEATRPQVLELADGDTLHLHIGPVAKRLGDTTVRMLGYNGSIPGPTLKVQQGSEIIVRVENQGDLDTTVHWHGLRLENRYDGVPHETQAPIPVGGEFTYRIQFPDAGLYWYHPHIREDYTQELGLYGNIVVAPAEADYWPPADRELVLTVDDLLVEDGQIAPFSREETSYAAMGRFGNVFLTSGDPDLHVEARAGEVVRLWLTNTANTRVFNLRVPGARMKLVGGDSGRVEHEELVDQVLVAPSERAVVDVLADRPGQLPLEHHTPQRAYRLATITVGEAVGRSAAAEEFERLRSAPELAAERQQLEAWLAAPPDKTLALVAQMDDPAALPDDAGPVTYVCPMHPEVTSQEPGRCPKCGMKLLAATGATMAEGGHAAAMEAWRPRPGRPRRAPWAWRAWRGRRNRVGRRHGRGQPPHHQRHHALEVPGPDHRRRQSQHRLAVPGRGAGQAAAGQRDGLRPPHAPPLPPARRRALPGPGPRRGGRAEPGLEGHRAGPHRPDRRPAVRRHQPGVVDGPLPHRRAHAERHDVQLHRHPHGGRRAGHGGRDSGST